MSKKTDFIYLLFLRSHFCTRVEVELDHLFVVCSNHAFEILFLTPEGFANFCSVLRLAVVSDFKFVIGFFFHCCNFVGRTISDFSQTKKTWMHDFETQFFQFTTNAAISGRRFHNIIRKSLFWCKVFFLNISSFTTESPCIWLLSFSIFFLLATNLSGDRDVLPTVGVLFLSVFNSHFHSVLWDYACSSGQT